jgi:hypothetical protein
MVLSKSPEQKIYTTLNDIDPIFGVMWRAGKFEFSDEFDTAAVEIIDGKFKILFNYKHWKKINHANRIFIICHEYLHVILGHWVVDKNVDVEWNNIAQDIQVNEMLVRQFNFNRCHIKGWRDMPWIDVVFREVAPTIEVGKDSEYYYSLIMRCL